MVPSLTAKKGFSSSSVSLKTLVLERVVFKQVVLETFSEHAPSLKELRIFDAAIEGKYNIFDFIGLAKLLRRLSLPLKSFHISTADRTRDRDLMPNLYRTSQGRTLWSNDFTIYGLQMNDQVHNHLTTLELVPKYGHVEYDNPYSALHNYLLLLATFAPPQGTGDILSNRPHGSSRTTHQAACATKSEAPRKILS